MHVGSDTVIKRFGPGGGERCAREWRALTLLTEHAPGLAPEPVSVDLTPDAPTVTMSKVDGEPLRGRRAPTRALARSVVRLHGALPPRVLARVAHRPGRPREVLEFARVWAPRVRPGRTGGVARALDDGLAWAARTPWEEVSGRRPSPVFGPGDGNLANYLWDGSRVRVVDFEESGRSDHLFELAEITEHVGSWVEVPLDVPGFLGEFALASADTARLHEYRRLLALVWLVMLCRGAGESDRNPPGTVDRQARRLTALLGADA